MYLTPRAPGQCTLHTTQSPSGLAAIAIWGKSWLAREILSALDQAAKQSAG